MKIKTVISLLSTIESLNKVVVSQIDYDLNIIIYDYNRTGSIKVNIRVLNKREFTYITNVENLLTFIIENNDDKFNSFEYLQSLKTLSN